MKRWGIWLVALLALALRLPLVAFGLPYELDPDESAFVDAAWQIVESGVGDPGWYSHPASTLLDTMAAVFWGYGAVALAEGRIESIAAAGELYAADVSHFYIIGRLVTVASGILVVLLTYFLARKLRIAWTWALVAALLMAVSPAMIQFSTIVRADLLMSGFVLLAVVLAMRTMVHPSGRAFALAGVALGLAAISKFTGALAIVPIVIANATLTVRQTVSPRRSLLWLGGTLAAAGITALLVAPFLFINVGDTLQAIRLEARGYHPGATGAGFLPDMWRFLREALPWGFGTPTTILAVAGTFVMALGRRPRVAAGAFWGLLAFLSLLSLWWLRWALPLLPLGAVAAVFLLDRSQRRLSGRLQPRLLQSAGAVVAVALVLPMMPTTIDLVAARSTGDDIRLRANEWVLETLPEGSTLLVDSGSTQVSSDDYDVRVIRDGEIQRWRDISGHARPRGYIDDHGRPMARHCG